MALTYHEASVDGSIGDEIFSGDVGTLMPKVTYAQLTTGATISSKLYIANDSLVDISLSSFSMDSNTAFTAILFESSGDAQVEGDLTGAEVDESPIAVVIPASGHKSFWLQVEVPVSSTETALYNAINLKQVLES